MHVDRDAMRPRPTGRAQRLRDAQAIDLGFEVATPHVVEEARRLLEGRAPRSAGQTLYGVENALAVCDLKNRLKARFQWIDQCAPSVHSESYCKNANFDFQRIFSNLRPAHP